MILTNTVNIKQKFTAPRIKSLIFLFKYRKLKYPLISKENIGEISSKISIFKFLMRRLQYMER